MDLGNPTADPRRWLNLRTSLEIQGKSRKIMITDLRRTGLCGHITDDATILTEQNALTETSLKLSRDDLAHILNKHSGIMSGPAFNLARWVASSGDLSIVTNGAVPGPGHSNGCSCLTVGPCPLLHPSAHPSRPKSPTPVHAPGATSRRTPAPQAPEPPLFACICGRTFKSELARQVHVVSGPGHERHDIPQAIRPKLGGAWVLFNKSDPNPYSAVFLAGAAHFPSRGLSLESSTSSEQQTLLAGL